MISDSSLFYFWFPFKPIDSKFQADMEELRRSGIDKALS